MTLLSQLFRYLPAFLAVGILAGTCAHAQTRTRERMLRDACQSDLQRYCKGDDQTFNAMSTCLQQYHVSVSLICRNTLKGTAQAR